MITSPHFINLLGRRFNRWLVINGPIERPRKNGRTQDCKWLCRCDCGAEKQVSGNSLKRGRSSSCGCYNRDRVIETLTRHGKNRTVEYRALSHIKERCLNPNTKGYNRYGERGITVCD